MGTCRWGWIVACWVACFVSSTDSHVSAPKVIYKSLQVSYVRALRPVSDERGVAGTPGKIGISSSAVVFAIYRVRFDREMFVHRWNGTAVRRDALPLDSPSPGYDHQRLENSDGLAGLVELSCNNGNGKDVFLSYDNHRRDDLLKEGAIPNQIASLPSFGSELLQFAEDAFYRAGQRDWRADEYVGAVLLYHERPFGPGGFSSQKAQANITRGILEQLPQFKDMEWRAALEGRLKRCSLEFKSLKDHGYWPPGELVDRNGSSAANLAVGDFTVVRPREEQGLRAPSSTHAPWLNVVSVNEEVMTKGEDPVVSETFRESLAHYPSVLGSWNHLVPRMPNYCGMQEGDLSLLQVQALQAHHETAFIAEQQHGLSMTRKQNEIPDAPNILEMVVKTLIPAVLKWFFEFFTSRAGARVSDQMGHKITAETPRDVVKLLEPPLAFNVSNLAVEAVTASLTQSVAHNIVADLGPFLAAELSKNLRVSLFDRVAPRMQSTIPSKLNQVIPYLLGRSLPVFLSEQLTRSLTHSLVPTLTQALTLTDDQTSWCKECEKTGKHCNYCHSSPQGMYYSIYYSAYYADYYSKFYTKYYTEALEKMEKFQHQNAEQGKAIAQNLGN
jgi:hypothetical protein